MTSESVAKEGLRGLWKNKSVVLPGLMNKLSTFVVNLVPQDTAAVAAGRIFSENK
jgi:short-subunit dehydrogenase